MHSSCSSHHRISTRSSVSSLIDYGIYNSKPFELDSLPGSTLENVSALIGTLKVDGDDERTATFDQSTHSNATILFRAGSRTTQSSPTKRQSIKALTKCSPTIRSQRLKELILNDPNFFRRIRSDVPSMASITAGRRGAVIFQDNSFMKQQFIFTRRRTDSSKRSQVIQSRLSGIIDCSNDPNEVCEKFAQSQLS